MYCPLPTIHDDLETLRTRLRQTRDAEQKQRLYLLVLIGEGGVKSRREAADYLAVHRNSIGRWLACYEREGLEGLLRVEAGGAPTEQRTLSAAAFAELQTRLREPEGFASYGAIQQWLAEERGEAVTYQAVHRLVHRRLKAKCSVSEMMTRLQGMSYNLPAVRILYHSDWEDMPHAWAHTEVLPHLS